MLAAIRSALVSVTIVGAALFALLFARPALAAPHCAAACPALSVSTTTPAAGAKLFVDGAGFGASIRVTLTLQGAVHQIRPAETDVDGAFREVVTLPSRLTGRHAIVASDPATGEQAHQLLSINASSRQAGDNDGAGSWAYVRVAVIGVGALAVVLLMGGTLLFLARRRRQLSL